jgi:hypothetical protein
MAELSSIQSGWVSYRTCVMPDEAGPTQITEMRQAFYAGAWFMLQAFNKVGAVDVSEDAGVAYLERLARDLEAFQDAVIQGGA